MHSSGLCFARSVLAASPPARAYRAIARERPVEASRSGRWYYRSLEEGVSSGPDMAIVPKRNRQIAVPCLNKQPHLLTGPPDVTNAVNLGDCMMANVPQWRQQSKIGSK